MSEEKTTITLTVILILLLAGIFTFTNNTNQKEKYETPIKVTSEDKDFYYVYDVYGESIELNYKINKNEINTNRIKSVSFSPEGNIHIEKEK